MPHSQTMLRAKSVARSMSLPAPAAMCPRKISSGRASAHQHGEHCFEIFPRVGVLVVFRQLHREAERHPSRNDRHFMNGVGSWRHRGNQRMSCLVISRVLLFFIRENHRLALDAHQHFVFGHLEVDLHHEFAKRSGSLAFVVSTAQAYSVRAPMASNGIDFVDEDDAGRVFLALFEQVAHAARPDADKHFHEVRTRNREEGNVRFARNRPGKQSLARPRRPDQQYALRNASAELLEFLRVFQKLMISCNSL